MGEVPDHGERREERIEPTEITADIEAYEAMQALKHGDPLPPYTPATSLELLGGFTAERRMRIMRIGGRAKPTPAPPKESTPNESNEDNL